MKFQPALPSFTVSDPEALKTEYAAAEMDAPVKVEAYVQDHQSWWDGKVTVYLQSEDGAYFVYEMACSEEDAARRQ